MREAVKYLSPKQRLALVNLAGRQKGGHQATSRACTARKCTNLSTSPRKPGVPNAAAALGWKPGLGAAERRQTTCLWPRSGPKIRRPDTRILFSLYAVFES